MDRVLALDASTTSVGWAVGYKTGRVWLSGVFLPDTRCADPKNWVERVYKFGRWLDTMIGYVRPGVLVYETPSSNRNQMVTRQLGSVEWHILDAGRRHGLPVDGINQNTIKKTGISKVGLDRAAEYKGGPLHEKRDYAGDEADALGALFWYYNVKGA